ncbi:MAG: helix-turn-helix domain-containing protein [Bacilli bacterium]
MLGKRIKQLRLEQGLTQQQLGDLVHVTRVSICCYEKEERTPTLDTIIDLANALKVDLNTLIGYDKFILSDNDTNYGINISKEEITLLLELRKNQKLYKDLIASPKRIIAAIMKKY